MADMPREPSRVGGVEAMTGSATTQASSCLWKFSSTCSNTNLLANGKEFVAVTKYRRLIHSLLSLRITPCTHYTKSWVYGLAEDTILSYS